MDTRYDKPLERVTNTAPLLKRMKVLFSDTFMERYTRFQNFEAFRYSSAVILNWNSETWVYSGDLLDLFVQESTDFPDWDSMVRAAITERSAYLAVV